MYRKIPGHTFKLTPSLFAKQPSNQVPYSLNAQLFAFRETRPGSGAANLKNLGVARPCERDDSIDVSVLSP